MMVAPVYRIATEVPPEPRLELLYARNELRVACCVFDLRTHAVANSPGFAPVLLPAGFLSV